MCVRLNGIGWWLLCHEFNRSQRLRWGGDGGGCNQATEHIDAHRTYDYQLHINQIIVRTKKCLINLRLIKWGGCASSVRHPPNSHHNEIYLQVKHTFSHLHKFIFQLNVMNCDRFKRFCEHFNGATAELHCQRPHAALFSPLLASTRIHMWTPLYMLMLMFDNNDDNDVSLIMVFVENNRNKPIWWIKLRAIRTQMIPPLDS